MNGKSEDSAGVRGRPQRRADTKELTRRRLMTSAMELLDERGGSKLSVSAISRRAGVAQSTFYVHFSDLGELLRVLGDEMAVRRGIAVREARRRVREQTDVERVRETFRIPLEEMTSNPDWYRMGLRVKHDPESPLGEVVREMVARERQDLVEDLVLAGYPVDTPVKNRSAEMVADCLAAMTEALARGNIEGRYPDTDELLDVLVQIFFEGVIAFFEPADSGEVDDIDPDPVLPADSKTF
jgi:TetR/AcrR family transcriptional regulator, fatty acid biosynthesis regulator